MAAAPGRPSSSLAPLQTSWLPPPPAFLAHRAPSTAAAALSCFPPALLALRPSESAVAVVQTGATIYCQLVAHVQPNSQPQDTITFHTKKLVYCECGHADVIILHW